MPRTSILIILIVVAGVLYVSNMTDHIHIYIYVQSGPKNVYTLAAVRRLRQCLDADGGHFEHLH